MHNSTNLAHVSIAGTDVEKIEYQGQPVVTFAMIDRVHGRPDGTASRTLRENRDRFEAGEDYFLVTYSQSDEIRRFGIDVPNRGLTLITRRGYLKITKSLNDDRAWDVFDEMVERYFTVEAMQQKQVAIPTTAEAFASAFQMIAQAERTQAEHAKAIASVEKRIEEVEMAQTVLTRKPAGSESITHIRRRIGHLYGLSTSVIDEVMRQIPYSPKPAAMVKNDHVDAEGTSYAVYWQKDVSKTFERFVAECEQVTPFMYTHPFIEGRFRFVGRKMAA